MPKASVIIPVYNGGDYIGETIDSILSQSFHDFELIIVDDGSTDDTADVIHGFRDSRIRYFHQPNSGKPASPRNNAIRKSEGDIIFIFDSDDIMLPGKLATTVQCMELAPGAGLAFTGFACIDETGTIIDPGFLEKNRTLQQLPKRPVTDQAHLIASRAALRGLAASNYLGTSGVAIRRDVFDTVGYFDEEVRNSDDFLMWQSIAHQYDLLYIPRIFHHYRVRSGSISLRNIEERAPGLIACVEKMKQFHSADPDALRLLDERIRRYYFEAGYSCFTQYRLSEARSWLLEALKKKIDQPALFYLCLSLLPASLISQLKQLKHRNSSAEA